MTANRDVMLVRVSIGLSIVGLLISGYLTWAHYAQTSVVCIGSSGCDTVQRSTYATITGIPVALLGILGYLSILGFLLLGQARGPLASYSPLITFGLCLIGAAYSLYLTYLELFVILAICQYCVASALIMLALSGLSTYRVLIPSPTQG